MRYFWVIIFLFGSYVPMMGQSLTIANIAAKMTDTLSDKVRLRTIIIIGNKSTRRGVILREMNVTEGMLLDKDSIARLVNLNKERLQNLSIFTDVVISVETINKDEVEWTVKLKEQWYVIPELTFKLADRNLNVWWDEQNHDIRRANIGVTLKHGNFRGNLEKLSVTAQIGYTQKFGMEYFRPYIDKKQQQGIGVSFFVAKNEEISYKTDSNKLRFVKTPGHYIMRQFEMAGVYVFRPGYAYKHQLEIRYRDHLVNDTVLKLNPDYYLNHNTKLRLLEFLYRFEINKVDNWNYPMKGYKTVDYAVARAGFDGINFQSYFQSELAYFTQLTGKLYSSHIFRGRLTFPEDQPYAYRYAMGSGSEYIRGYEYYVIDGSQYGLLRNNIKYELLNINIRNIPLRYLPVIPLRLYPKVFTDIGYAHNHDPGNSFLNDRLLYSAGAGVDFITAYNFKIRIEYTWNHLGEKGLFLHLDTE